MNFKITSTIAFLIFLQYLEKASGVVSCDDVPFDPDSEYCLTNGDNCASTFCKVGYCRKGEECVPKFNGACDKECAEGQLVQSNFCYCIGSTLVPDCLGFSRFDCSTCTNEQVCSANSLPCLGDIPICDVEECQNGGTCSGSTIEDYTCACVEGYKGRHCEIEIPKFGC